MVARSSMGARETMSSSKPSGLRKLFGRRGSKKASQTLKVAETPPEINAIQQHQQQSNTAKAKRRGFWSREEERGASTPVAPIEQSSESSEDIGVIRNDFDENHVQESNQSQQLQDVQEHIRSIRPMDDSRAPESSRNNAISPIVEIAPIREGPRLVNLMKSKDAKAQAVKDKQLLKERDGFCRRVDTYDGSVITVEGQAAYELGNYLGGGVAGVVYEGHRLLPVTEYPVRTGCVELPKPSVIDVIPDGSSAFDNRVNSLLSCVPSVGCVDKLQLQQPPVSPMRAHHLERDDGSFLTMDSYHSRAAVSLAEEPPPDSVALEAVDHTVLIDAQGAPNRSKHMAKAVTDHTKNTCFPSDASFTGAGFMEETVAIKILNPVGFRTLAPEVTNTTVIAREGAPFPSKDAPLEEKHVWWLVNPQSRNLRTLQRYTIDTATPRGVEVDRGNSERGLRISLIAAFKDPTDGLIKELPLTRCIEIWGHIPFQATDTEFREIMTAIDKINQGLPPPAIQAFDDAVPGRVSTQTSSLDGSLFNGSQQFLSQPTPLSAKRTGIYRAASSKRTTVFCSELQAYIALPAVPSKYLKWLRQRRAATKEIRNMMLIGRHRNVVHLFEVLELIQETKSTMFLILELVRGGELFDLISSNTAKLSTNDSVPAGYTESETVMRKFFLELASGIQYCHLNNIAHRDLKPENLLVHNAEDGNCTLKIADFGLSAVFGQEREFAGDNETIGVESYVSGPAVLQNKEVDSILESNPLSPIKQQVNKLLTVGNTALGFFTCGNVEDIINCQPKIVDVDVPPPLRRMTSVVGSPHYVAPEIVSQHDKRSQKNEMSPPKGYDGTKADVWSAGVILYAMLFRSLPFGEDLLRCPRYLSFKKWYEEVLRGPRSRRSDILAPLNPTITESEDRDLLGPHWFFPSDSSPESRDLIVYMLNPNPDLRPSIQLILQHPWLLKKA